MQKENAKVSTSQVTQKKRILLRELLKKEEPIWVRNRSDQIAKQFKLKPGNVVFQIGSGDTRGKVVVPAGRDPVCISDQVDSESLKTCRDLFRLIERGTLELLDPQYADKYYAQNESRRDVVANKIDKVRYNIQDEKAKPKAIMTTDVQLDPSILNLCLQLKKDATTMEAALEYLNENNGAFDEDSLQYLQSNGKYKEIKLWARRELKQLEKQ